MSDAPIDRNTSVPARWWQAYGDPQLDASGRPIITFDDGVPMLQRLPALVNTAANQGEALGLARKSRLIEILSGQLLDAGSDAVAAEKLTRASGKGKAGILFLKREGCLEIGNDGDSLEQARDESVCGTGGTDDIGRPAHSAVGQGAGLLLEHRE